MSPEQEMVREFHDEFGQPAPRRFVEVFYWGDDLKKLRVDLIQEELNEFKEALESNDTVASVDALMDLLYVVYGAVVTMGLDAAPIFAGVHRTNMAKVKGGFRADGKVLKPEGWKPPDIAGEIKKQALKRARRPARSERRSLEQM